MTDGERLQDERKHLETLLQSRINFFLVFGGLYINAVKELGRLAIVLALVVSLSLLAGILRTYLLVEFDLKKIRDDPSHPYTASYDGVRWLPRVRWYPQVELPKGRWLPTVKWLPANDCTLPQSANTLLLVASVSLFAVQAAFGYLHWSPSQEALRVNVLAVPPIRVNPPGAPPSAKAPEPIELRFESGRAELTAAHRQELQKIRDYAVAHPNAIVLLHAHTDTTGSPDLNRRLTHRRAEAVRKELAQPGGIAARAIFSAEMGVIGLPRETGPRVREAQNRVVRVEVR